MVPEGAVCYSKLGQSPFFKIAVQVLSGRAVPVCRGCIVHCHVDLPFLAIVSYKDSCGIGLAADHIHSGVLGILVKVWEELAYIFLEPVHEVLIEGLVCTDRHHRVILLHLEKPVQVVHIDKHQREVHHCSRIRLDDKSIAGEDKTSDSVDDPEPDHRGHEHGDNNKERSEITDKFYNHTPTIPEILNHNNIAVVGYPHKAAAPAHPLRLCIPQELCTDCPDIASFLHAAVTRKL